MLSKSISSLAKRVSSGLTPLRSNPEFWLAGTIPWLKTEQLGEKFIYSTTEKISKIALKKTSIKICPPNTLTIAMYGEGKTRGNVSIIKSEMATNQACCNIELDPELADFEYVYYFLKTQYNELRSLSSGVRKNLNSEDIKNFVIRLPQELKDQRKVAAVLSALDAKIDCNNRINAELESMAKTLYDYWFVQFDFPDANGKPYKSSGGKMVYNATLGREIPHGWAVGPLSEWIAKDKTGDWGKDMAEGNYTLSVDCIRGTDINGLNGKGPVAAPTRFILERNRAKILAPFDLVIEISGGSPTQSTGRLALMTSEAIKRFSRPVICSNFCKAISLKNSAYAFNFAYLWKSAYENKVLFGWEGKTSGIKNLLFDAFTTKHMVCMPPQNQAQRFFDFVSPIEDKRQKRLQENESLEALRDWLLPLLMNGQVTVA
jgi:type I restriction enzyme, S subunit